MRNSLTVLAVGLLVLAASTLAGCGLKGDLYLPEDDPEAASPQPGEEQEDTESSDPPAD